MSEILTNYLDNLGENLFATLNTPDAYLNKIALTVVVIIVGILLHFLLKNLITKQVSIAKQYRFHRALKNSVLTLTIIAVLFIWIQAINALILIALSVGFFIVVLVRGLINNIIGWFVIKHRKYFRVGHRVEINEIIGDVIEINPISFQLLEVRNWLSSDSNTGRVIKLPNRIIFEESIEMVGVDNQFIWHEISYVLTFESDWQAAEKIMLQAGNRYFEEVVVPDLEKTNKRVLTKKDSFKPVFALDTTEAGIRVSLKYLINYLNGTKAKTQLQREILLKIKEKPNLEFAVLDVRILQN